MTMKPGAPPESPVVYLAPFVTEGKAGLVASTSDWGPKAVYVWTLTGGTLTSGQGSRTITFTAGVAGTTLTAQVVVTAYGGSGSGSASASVVSAPNAELALPLKTHPGDAWMKASVPHQQGMTYLWSIVPGNGRASITAGQGTHVIGFSAGPSAGTFHLKVDVQNQAGDAVASTRKVTIQTGTWLVKNGGASVTRYPCQSTRLPSGRVLVTGGGGNSAEVYDPETGHWNLVGSMTNPRGLHTSTLLHTGQVLVAGNGTAELYDPASGTWHPTGKPGTSRSACTATLLPDGKVLAAGGHTATAEVYDPATGTWTPTGSMGIARTFHTATRLLDGKVLVAGGSEDNPATELYDPANGTWVSTGSLNLARNECAATLLADGKVLVTGGSIFARDMSSAEIYDPGTGTWTPTATMGPERRFHTTTLLPDGRVLMAGGERRDNFLFSTAIYDPVASTWTPAGNLGTGRFGHKATLLQDGTVLVTGGRGSLYFYGIASSEIYDPGNGTWKPLAGQPRVPREFHTATLLANGQALVTGGENFLGGDPETEIAAPETGYWTPAKNMGATRMGHTATLLSDGKVLVVGGDWQSQPGFTTAELYDPAEGSWTSVGNLNETR
ncbi:MAG TPA: kelch repeat-containing protein, partial [Holophagaceae bacterium]|nr:kelch repeat-containing protein [Holophagaceae bacterium]